MEDKGRKPRTDDEKGSHRCDVPARYLLVVTKVANSFVLALMDGSLSLAITVMVGKKSSSHATPNVTASTDVCPVTHGHSSVTAQQDQQEGEFDWDELTQSFVTNATTCGALFTILIGARLVELWSPKKLLVYSSFVYTPLHMLVPVFARWNVYALIASRILYGIIAAPSTPGFVSLMAAWFPPDERQFLNGIINCVVSIGSIASTSVSGYLITKYGWELLFYLYGSLHIASNLIYVFFVYDTPQEHPRISEEERNYLVRTINKQSKTGYIASAIHATTWFSELFFSVLSRWLNKKRYFSLLTTYRIFNAIAMLGPVATLVAVAQAGCNSTLIVSLLVLHFFISSAVIAGSVLNYMDLSINFAPTLSAFATTIGNAVAIASPTVAGVLTNNQQTLTAWSKIFYISAVVSALPYAIFFVFGSTEEQPWNRPEHLRDDNKIDPEAVVEMSVNCSPGRKSSTTNCAKARSSSAALLNPKTE